MGDSEATKIGADTVEVVRSELGRSFGAAAVPDEIA
jgi:hypothetical protein